MDASKKHQAKAELLFSNFKHLKDITTISYDLKNIPKYVSYWPFQKKKKKILVKRIENSY